MSSTKRRDPSRSRTSACPGFTSRPDYVFAVRDDGTLYEAKSGEWRWNRVAAVLEGIQTISLTA